MTELDVIDVAILKNLLVDGRKDFREIAEECGISEVTIGKHYKKMEKKGIIIGATTQVDHVNLQPYLMSEILLENVQVEARQMEEVLSKIPNALGVVYSLVGNWFVILRINNDLGELEHAKSILRNNFPSAIMKTLLWTGSIRNIPENLSFGLSEKVIREKCSTQSQPAVTIVKKPCKVDQLDADIADKLTKNGRCPFSKIAEDLGVTTDTVARRYKNLKECGLLRTVIQIRPSKIGYKANLDIRVRLKSTKNHLSTLIDTISEIPDVFHVSGTSGDYDLHIWALVRDFEHMFLVSKRLSSIPDFGNIDIKINKMFLDMYPTPSQHTTTT